MIGRSLNVAIDTSLCDDRSASCNGPTSTGSPQTSHEQGREMGSGARSDDTSGVSENEEFLREKFEQAFGAPLVNEAGDDLAEVSATRQLWWRVVALKGRQYTLPDGNVGTRFVHLLSAEIEKCTLGRQCSEVEFVLVALVLQRDKMVKSGKDIRRLLNRRMDLWEAGRRWELVHEAERCDRQLAQGPCPLSSEHVERVLNRVGLQGKVCAAVRFLTKQSGGGVLDPELEACGKSGPLGKTVFEVLKEKQPLQRQADPNAFLDCDDLPPLVQVEFTAGHIKKVAWRLSGSAGPSGTDAAQWRALLLPYGNASAPLREANASSTRRHANEVVPWEEMRAFLARRGIALDKLPGVCPIGIGECQQRMEAKALALAVGIDVQELCGADQLCSGEKAGTEAAFHVLKDIFAEEETEGLLLVDGSNAFNVISRLVSLWNCRVLWPICSVFLFNS